MYVNHNKTATTYNFKMKMKIGVLTYHSGYNFGANLQAFTTFRYLQSIGHEVKIIDFNRQETRIINRNFVPKAQWFGHDSFIENELPLTRHIDNKEDLCSLIMDESFDGIIVGADAVWSYPQSCSEIPVYFLDWLFNNSKICHIPAASLSVANMSNGFKHLNRTQIKQLKECLLKFKYISVRDNWTKTTVTKHVFSGVDINVLLNPDPVFCMDSFITTKWDNLKLVNSNEKFILVSLGTSKTLIKWAKRFKKAANRAGYLLGELPLPEGSSGIDCDFKVPYPINPIQWYLWLKNCDAYIGLRFHAVVSCITVGTPFYSVDSYGNRHIINSIINKLGFYRLGRMFDHKSKIFNLLKNTHFENFRVNSIGLGGVNPRKLIRLLESVEKSSLIALKEMNSSIFKKNIGIILNVFRADY